MWRNLRHTGGLNEKGADGIMALKYSVKKKLTYYIKKKVKLGVGTLQRHLAL
jgi:hypothetical protein